jgi:hypothetical protein
MLEVFVKVIVVHGGVPSSYRHYDVEGKMRGVAPSKKIAAVQQKNVDL